MPRSSASSLPLALSLALLSGCGMGTLAPPTASLTAGPALSGTIFGGAQPISGATVRVYAVGNTGNGSAATDILTGPLGSAPNAYATTDTSGAFHINGDYICPSNPSTPIYIVATGGNPGITGTVNNTSIALVAALGPCNAINTSNHIVLNEATTAAAAWALAPFATSITNIGASTTNLAGITQAFSIASQLVDTTLGTSPNASIASYSVVESAKLYSLADILATCVNSSGSDGKCTTLFSTAGLTPSDTFAAALTIVKNPANNVANLFNLVSGDPTFPALASAPNDWTMTITYSEAYGGTSPLANANINTIDQQGNLWGSLEYQSAILKFSPTFAPLVNVNLYPFDGTNDDPGFDDTGRKTGVMSIDPSGNLWFASNFSLNFNTGFDDNPSGAVFELDPNGNVLSGAYGYTNGGVFNPWMAMADTNSFVWVGSLGYYDTPAGAFINPGGDMSLLSPTGVAESPITGWNVDMSFQPRLIDFDAYHNAWVINSKAASLYEFPPYTTGNGLSQANTATIYPIPSPATDIVFDTLNQGWFAYGPIGKITTSSTVQATAITSGSGLIKADELAVDASNRIWALNLNANLNGGYFPGATLSVFSGGAGNGAALSPIALGTDIAAVPFFQTSGNGFLIDNAGSILVDNMYTYTSYNPNTLSLSGSVGLVRFVGLATPTKTPNTGPPQAP